MEQKQTKDSLNSIIQAINNIVEPKVASLRYDKTYRAKVTKVVDTGIYKVQVNGVEYQLSYNGTLSVGDIVKVKAPLNNFSDIYIETLPSSGGGGDGTTNYNNLLNKPTLNTSNASSLEVNSNETLKGNISLHKISKTGSYNDLLNKPSLDFILTSQKGAASGVATLGTDKIVPKIELPTDIVYDSNYRHINVENVLTSTSVTNALSANQGKVLTERISNNDTMITNLQEDIILAEDNITKIKKDYIPLTQKGYANGVATLDMNMKLVTSQLPIATKTTVGVIKIGDNLSIGKDGTLNAAGTGGDITNQLLEKIYPIGSIYISANRISPQQFLGGIWEPFAYGRTLVGVDDRDADPDMDFAEPLKTGGEKEHTLTVAELANHTHTFTGKAHLHTYSESAVTSGSTTLTIDQMPSHRHTMHGRTDRSQGSGAVFREIYGYNEAGIAENNVDTYATGGGKGHTHSITLSSTNTGTAIPDGTNSDTGSDIAHNNMQPYITVYMWKRVS